MLCRTVDTHKLRHILFSFSRSTSQSILASNQHPFHVSPPRFGTRFSPAQSQVDSCRRGQKQKCSGNKELPANRSSLPIGWLNQDGETRAWQWTVRIRQCVSLLGCHLASLSSVLVVPLYLWVILWSEGECRLLFV
jgi:hypothetical protein